MNHTIDDQGDDSTSGFSLLYSPSDGWSDGQSCPTCKIQLDPSQCHNGTWSDTTAYPGTTRMITAQFNGTAVYVYGIIANMITGIITLTNLTFLIDGIPSGTFSHYPTTSTVFEYNVLLYSNTSLQNAEHTIVMNASSDPNASLVLFDYLVYTSLDGTNGSDSSPTSTSPSTQTQPPSSHSSTPVGAIAGGTVGGVILVVLVAFLWYFRRRREKAGSSTTISEGFGPLGMDGDIQPFNLQTARAVPFSEKAITLPPRISTTPLNLARPTADTYPVSSTYTSPILPTPISESTVPAEVVQSQDGDVAQSSLSTTPPLSPADSVIVTIATSQPESVSSRAPTAPISKSPTPLADRPEFVARLLPPSPSAQLDIPSNPAVGPLSPQTNVSTLVGHVLALREEVARLREAQEVQQSGAPPQYMA